MERSRGLVPLPQFLIDSHTSFISSRRASPSVSPSFSSTLIHMTVYELFFLNSA